MLLKFLLHDIWITCTSEYLRFTGIQSATLREREREKKLMFFSCMCKFLCIYSKIEKSDFHFFCKCLQVMFVAFILSTKLTYNFVFFNTKVYSFKKIQIILLDPFYHYMYKGVKFIIANCHFDGM